MRAEVLWRRDFAAFCFCSPSFCPAASSSPTIKKPRRVFFFSLLLQLQATNIVYCFYRLDSSIHTHSKCLPPMPPSPRSSRPTLRCDDSPCGSLYPSSFDRSVGFYATSPLSDDISMLEGGNPAVFAHLVYTDPPALFRPLLPP